jgi:F-type H+-transporting ATPase subunit b
MDIGFLNRFAATEEATPEGGLAVLGINPVAFMLQLITFLILFFILRKFAFNKIIKLLEERRLTIDKGVDLGREMTAQKQQLDERINQALHEARIESDKIIAAAHHESGVIIKQAEETATRKTDAMLSDAHAKIEDDIELAQTGLEKELRVLVAEATEAVIGEKLDAAKDAGLIERTLRKVRA